MKRLLLFTLLISSFTYISANSPEIKSADQPETPPSTYLSVLLNKVRLTGYGHLGYTYNSHQLNNGEREGNPANTFDLKRIMFMAEAEVFRNMTLYFMYDFGGSKVHELWGEYKISNALKIRLGQYKTPFTIENLLSQATLEIIEGAQSVQYLAGITGSDVAYGGKAGRDLGLMFHGDFLRYNSWDLFSYKIGVFNGQGINVRDQNNQKDIMGMLMVNPLKEISVGGSFHIGTGKAQSDSPFGAFNAGDNYTRNRWSLSTEITTTPLYIRAEYLQGKDGNIRSEGYYAVLKYHVLPKIDLIASYDYFNPNTTNDDYTHIRSKQTNYIIGTQWNFYRRCRFQVQYVFQERTKGWDNSNLIMTQFQLGF